MDVREPNRAPQEELSALRERPHKTRLPCGSRVCLRCHKGCGVAMAAYLSGLDEPQEIREESL